MKTVLISAEIQIPAEATESEILEWIKFRMAEIGGIPITNPLVGFELVSRKVKITSDD